MQSEATVLHICKSWLESDHVPQFLKVKNSEGTTTMYSFNLVVDFVLRNLGGKFNYENLNRALQQLIKSGRIPAHKGQKQDANGLWHNPPNVDAEKEKQHQRELAHMGVVKDNRSHAEEEKKESPNTLSETLKKVMGQISRTQNYVPKSGAKEVVRHLPDDATQEQLQQATPAELKAYLKRQRDKQRLEQSPF